MAGKKTTKKKAKTPKGSKDDKINEETRQIKQAYLASSKQFLTEPISALLKTFDTSLTESKPIDNIVIHSMLIKSSDISAIGISFKGYERLVGTCIWYSIVHSNVLQSIVSVLCRPALYLFLYYLF